MFCARLRKQSVWLTFHFKVSKALPLAHTQLGIADIPKGPIEAEGLAASTELSIAQWRFGFCTERINIDQSGTLLTTSGYEGFCLLAPTRQSGSVYYLRFELLCCHPHCEMFFGVIGNTDLVGKGLKPDAGWFVGNWRGRNCRRTNMKLTQEDAWSGWQQGDQPVFKVDLATHMLHVRLARLQQDYTANFAHSFGLDDPIFCVAVHFAFGEVVVKALPVLAAHQF